MGEKNTPHLGGTKWTNWGKHLHYSVTRGKSGKKKERLFDCCFASTLFLFFFFFLCAITCLSLGTKNRIARKHIFDAIAIAK